MVSIPVNATPQKRLFLSIIADYDLTTSLSELIDNALDHWMFSGRRQPLSVKLVVNTDRQSIRISDSAGGVRSDSLELLVAPGASRGNVTQELIGNFGVGGKRAGIALGERVSIRTRFANDPTYEIVLDSQWLAAEDNWQLTAEEVSDIESGSTVVAISELRQGINLEQISVLEKALGSTYAKFLNADCEITLNGSPVLIEKFDNWAFPPDYRPKSSSFFVTPVDSSDDEVKVKITAGLILDRDPKEGNYGVYFYCNDRLVLAHEKSAEVGYYKGKAGTVHPDASLCRVIVELHGNPELMPWTSNKAGINWNHPTFLSLREKIVEMTTYYTTVSRRTKSDRENEVFRFDSGEIENFDISSPNISKKIVQLPTPRGRRKSYCDRLVEQNQSMTRSKPWTLGIVESMGLLEVVIGKRYETKNRVGLIILDSNLEIGLKEFLVNHPTEYYPDAKIADLFKQRHKVVDEVIRLGISPDLPWGKARYYNGLRNKFIHERATVEITDTQLMDYRDVVESILSALFDLSFDRD
ncbi:ATP-binding protein [Thalassovita sp.]|uniref:ATP-binding protein n=1 Tax=Thalassovita sp. TaxID=1979401 RepID=UPI0028817830|nr:ATP-binding protein [Thalassovita sp.]MDF1801740.1 ATP-binding protein [Thalassovita sp.]